MTKRMLIDATHPEETRVVVVKGSRLEDFDFESSTKKQIKGNIYLARVTRVEPSLQAAFVEYGGNRHGFLAFSEIHPDYYRIPVEDREKLLAEEKERLAAEEGGNGGSGESVETLGGDEATDADEDEAARRRRHLPRRYKIQEVVNRRQIMLVQVVKEERGNKGAALTTYLSLAGRYCVLMPSTSRGGGVSRKITNAVDRRRLKKIVEELEVPEGMAVIVRTAGADRTKAEIKRDFEYLIRLWDDIREKTLQSTAPCLVHEEASLIKRALRDLYSKDIDEVIIDGDDGYRIAKDYMKALVPSHAKKVQRYKDEGIPLLQRYQIESQLDAIHSPTMQLRSGGYIVINQAEALVAIDVNSGRATRERNIEETALKTNLEAADEIARQLRLRDLAGLIVIDFIDMEEGRNQNAVERRLKDALKNDRARIQVGRISPFGLLEMSRQRLRPSLAEASTQVCPHCGGTGHIRSTESTALTVLRAIEEEGVRRRAAEIIVHVPPTVAVYILNHKRPALEEIEARHSLKVIFHGDESLVPPAYRIDRAKPRPADEARPPATAEEAVAATEEPEAEEEAAAIGEPGSEEREGDRRRRRRRRGRRRGEERPAAEAGVPEEEEEAVEEEGEEEREETPASSASGEEDEASPRRRRRGRRGGRRRHRGEGEAGAPASAEAEAQAETEVEAEIHEPGVEGEVEPPITAAGSEAVEEAAATGAEAPAVAAPEAAAEPQRRRRRRTPRQAEVESEAAAEPAEPAAEPVEAATAVEPLPEPEAEATAEPEAPVEQAAEHPEQQPEPELAALSMAAAAEQEQPAADPAAERPQRAENQNTGTTIIEVKDEPPPQPRRGWWNRAVQ